MVILGGLTTGAAFYKYRQHKKKRRRLEEEAARLEEEEHRYYSRSPSGRRQRRSLDDGDDGGDDDYDDGDDDGDCDQYAHYRNRRYDYADMRDSQISVNKKPQYLSQAGTSRQSWSHQHSRKGNDKDMTMPKGTLKNTVVTGKPHMKWGDDEVENDNGDYEDYEDNEYYEDKTSSYAPCETPLLPQLYSAANKTDTEPRQTAPPPQWETPYQRPLYSAANKTDTEPQTFRGHLVDAALKNPYGGALDNLFEYDKQHW